MVGEETVTWGAVAPPPAPGAGGAARPSALDERAVPRAFALGWHMAELYHAEALPVPPRQSDEPAPARLPGFGALAAWQQVDMYLAQVDELITALGPVDGAGAGCPPTRRVRAERALGHASAEPVRRAIADLHTDVLRGLTATDFRLGKAYGLGRALSETVLLGARGPEGLAELLRPGRVATLEDWLERLRSAFPRHAAYAVKETLDDWVAWVRQPRVYAGPGARSSSQQLASGGRSQRGARSRLLAAARPGRERRGLDWSAEADRRLVGQWLERQGTVWYALLSGETVPTDLLVVEDYAESMARVQTHVRRLMWGALHRHVSVGVVVVGAGSAAVAVAGLAMGATRVAAALGAFAAVLGLSWKSVTGGMTGLLHAAERPLASIWDAEVAETVAYATRLLPSDPPVGVAAAEAAGTPTAYPLRDAAASPGRRRVPVRRRGHAPCGPPATRWSARSAVPWREKG